MSPFCLTQVNVSVTELDIPQFQQEGDIALGKKNEVNSVAFFFFSWEMQWKSPHLAFPLGISTQLKVDQNCDCPGITKCFGLLQMSVLWSDKNKSVLGQNSVWRCWRKHLQNPLLNGVKQALYAWTFRSCSARGKCQYAQLKYSLHLQSGDSDWSMRKDIYRKLYWMHGLYAHWIP